MASNGGTLNGVPQQEQRSLLNNSCNTCGLSFDSSESLNVHIHYHHNNGDNSINRWHSANNSPIHANNSPTDSENNNQPKHSVKGTAESYTISAAADSSDNQPGTPQSVASTDNNTLRSHNDRQSAQGFNQTMPATQYPTPYHANNMHYPGYGNSYDPYTAVEFRSYPPASLFYRNAPPNAYADYLHGMQQPIGNGSAHAAAAAAISAAASQTSISPTVSSSSPNQNGLMPSGQVLVSTSTTPTTATPIGQPTPSPSPRHCHKCGFVCGSIAHLNEHMINAHNMTPTNDSTGNGDIENDIPSFQYTNFKGEQTGTPNNDILDLDSHKMVYPPHELNQQNVPLPPMHSLHPMQRPGIAWPHPTESTTFMPPSNDLKYASIKNEFTPPNMKQEHMTQLPNPIAPNTAQNENAATSPSEFPSTTTPQENGAQFRSFEPATSTHPNGAPLTKATTWKSNEARRPKTYNCTACNKWFTSSGHLKRHYNTTLHKNAVKSSGQPDPATLPISVHHHPTRDPTAKSRYVRTGQSSAGRQSAKQQAAAANAQPAQLAQQAPIPAQPQQQPQTQQQIHQSHGLVNDSVCGPEYPTQYQALSSAQNHPSNNVGFQQYNQLQNASVGMHPNGLAGLCASSQARDLLTFTNTPGVYTSNHMQDIQQQQRHQSIPDFCQAPQIQPHHMPASIMDNTNSMEANYNIIQPIAIRTHTNQLYPIQRPLDMNYTTIGNSMADAYNGCTSSASSTSSLSPNAITSTVAPPATSATFFDGNGNNYASDHMMKSNDEYYGNGQQEYRSYDECMNDAKVFQQPLTSNPAIAALRRLNNDIYHADTVPPFSPDTPDKRRDQLTPQTHDFMPTSISPNAQHSHTMVDLQPILKMEPSSPSISSSEDSMKIDDSELLTTKTTKAPRRSKKRIDADKLITDTIPIGDDPLRCAPCDKVFNKACYLTQHNKTFHSGEKPYKCLRCGKRFSCNASHNEHMQKHLGDKPFKCSMCTKEFNHKTDLRRHMCLHTGTKPYTCEICKKGFIRKDHMVKHGQTHLKKSNRAAEMPKLSCKMGAEKKLKRTDKLVKINQSDDCGKKFFSNKLLTNVVEVI